MVRKSLRGSGGWSSLGQDHPAEKLTRSDGCQSKKPADSGKRG